jgi:hypothetical protein
MSRWSTCLPFLVQIESVGIHGQLMVARDLATTVEEVTAA